MVPGERHMELEEDADIVCDKVNRLAQMIRSSKSTIVYTGAGISTAAEIPDYRGPNGVWTLTSQGKEISSCADMTKTNPTSSHMVLKELYRHGKIHHILSQNCDGLHLRSGLPQKCLSEIHGNMFVEVCTHCDPPCQYFRSFDVTEKSQFREHKTGRCCSVCGFELVDTIVHFGEVGKLKWPLNWTGTTSKVEDADLILCIGTSLNVLKSYKFLWPASSSKTKLVIINLQWTPKNNKADLIINSKSDVVLLKLAEVLHIDPGFYCRDCDPVLNPRRGSRGNELMNKINDCSCHIRAPRSLLPINDQCDSNKGSSEGSPGLGHPGWWAAGIQRMKRKLSVQAKVEKIESEPQPVRKSARVASLTLLHTNARRRGRPRKKATTERETLFERDVRLTVLSLVDSLDPALKRSRGRPKLTGGRLQCEKEGSFKCKYDKEDTSVTPSTSSKNIVKHDYDSEADAEELTTDSDEEGSIKDDPSFRIPKQQLLKLSTRTVTMYPRRRSSDVAPSSDNFAKKGGCHLEKEVQSTDVSVLALSSQSTSASTSDSADVDVFETSSSDLHIFNREDESTLDVHCEVEQTQRSTSCSVIPCPDNEDEYSADEEKEVHSIEGRDHNSRPSSVFPDDSLSKPAQQRNAVCDKSDL